jgi:hypothetical protein
MTSRSTLQTLSAFAVIGVFAVGMLLGTSTRSASVDLGGLFGDIIKVGGVGLLIAQFADELNDAINGLLDQRGIAVQGMTKVVPIIRMGTKGGTQVGGAQVVGPAQQVERVKAVAEVQLDLGPLRGRGLIPVETRNPLRGEIKGVDGVGVSASIKVRI